MIILLTLLSCTTAPEPAPEPEPAAEVDLHASLPKAVEDCKVL